MKRRTQLQIESIKSKLCDIWGQIKMRAKDNPMTTREVFAILKFDYDDISDREVIYRINRECQDEAEHEWDRFSVVDGDMEKVFKEWMEYCWLNKKPYILFVKGQALTPRTFHEWERLLEETILREVKGLTTSITRMTSKDMKMLRSKYYEVKGYLDVDRDELKKLEMKTEESE